MCSIADACPAGVSDTGHAHAGNLGNGTADGRACECSFSLSGEAVRDFVKTRLLVRLGVILSARVLSLGELIKELEAPLERLLLLGFNSHAVACDSDAHVEGRARGEWGLLLFVHFIFQDFNFQTH